MQWSIKKNPIVWDLQEFILYSIICIGNTLSGIRIHVAIRVSKVCAAVDLISVVITELSARLTRSGPVS